ncbi:MAG: DUF1761 domain-containing protein [Nanoarchaeota archaeon]|nr:DUF1761 domain-containing protein [Nanoarchaeota archaeon]
MNYLGVVLAALASMVLGWLWYGPLFGKMWIAAMKIDPKKGADMKKNMGKSYFGMIISSLLTFFVLAKLMETFSITTMNGALMLGLWIWLGFVLTVEFGSVLWEGRSSKVFFINSAYELLKILVGAWVLTRFV